MPNARVNAIERLFKFLSSAKSPKLFREDFRPPEKFSEGHQRVLGESMQEVGEPGGIYYATTPRHLPGLIGGYEVKPEDIAYRRLNKRKDRGKSFWSDSPDQNVIAIPLPGSRHRTFTKEEWIDEGYANMPFRKLTTELKKKYDFVTFPDIVTESNLPQTVQLNPEKAVARLGSKPKGVFKILGASGAAAGATLGNEEEANAMPLGRFFKAGEPLAQRALQSAPSRTASKLIGETLEGQWFKEKQLNGKIIKNVTQGVDDKVRNIIFDDGTVQEIDAKDLSYIMAEMGNISQINKFHMQPPESKQMQAVKGLQHAYDRVGIGFKSLADSFITERNTALRNIYGEPRHNSAGVYFGNQYLIIPKPYAEHLNGSSVTLKNGMTGKVRMDKKPLGE